jgi:hypothetical protein
MCDKISTEMGIYRLDSMEGKKHENIPTHSEDDTDAHSRSEGTSGVMGSHVSAPGNQRRAYVRVAHLGLQGFCISYLLLLPIIGFQLGFNN